MIATSVLTAQMVDLTKRQPPPATPDEEALDAIMKRIVPAFTAVRQAIDQSNGNEVRRDASTLQQAFTEVEAFWAKRARADAVSWARTARLQSDAIGQAAAATEWASAKTSLDALGQQCQACHAVYRDAFDDGSFRIKKPL
jgi:cytochrome c556